ncbi:MAG: ankyrin repeat domain-containing protein [Verrucomicrobia bacterium]|nr:ankyrin repeat domain-containing protein [Verrucomicrobiota bacterium]
MGAGISRTYLACLLLIGAALLGSCDTPQKRALRELSEAGVEVSGWSLVQAVLRHDLPQSRLLLEAGVHTEQRDSRGRTPLRIAVEYRDPHLALLLIEAQADVNATTADGVSVLGVVIASGHPVVVGSLLTSGARGDARLPDGERILPWAIRAGRLPAVRLMLGSGTDPHLKDQLGNPLLHIAIECGRRNLVDALIKLGADPGTLNANGESTLQLALRRGWLDAVPQLVAGGADPNLASSAGLTPLEQALGDRDRTVLALMLRCGADPNLVGSAGLTPLERVIAARDPDLLGLLLQGGADPNLAGSGGLTPLERVIAARDPGLLGLLLQGGADPNHAGAARTTAVHAAIRLRWAEGMHLLARVKADFNRPDAAGLAPLENAFAANDHALLGLLLGVGVDPGFRDSRRRGLVEDAAAAGRGSLVKLLLDYGCPAGNALYAACTRGDSTMARLLLACGVAPDSCRTPTFDSPLAAALRARNDALAAGLIAHGAAINARLAEGQSPLHLAIATGCHGAVKGLLDAGANPNAPFCYPVSPAFIRVVRSGIMQWELRTDRNLTPLMLAADAGVSQSAVHLLAAGARKNVWARNTRFSPLNFAALREDVKMMRVLLGQDPEREERRIVVSLAGQRVRVFDAAGKEIFNSKVSTGRSGYATHTGDFVITDKNRTWTSTIYHASMPYFQRLNCGDFGLHQGYVSGNPASHGCIRVPAGKAAELFAMTRVGDRVQIVP